MLFDLLNFEAVVMAVLVSAYGVPIVLVVIGLVYAIGDKFGINGRWQFVTSLLIGLVLGGGYQLAIGGPAVGFAGWFGYVVYGLFMGLLASWLYDTAKDLLAKIVEKMLGFNTHGEG